MIAQADGRWRRLRAMPDEALQRRGLEPTFHDMVAFRATAERALARFAKGDSFVAEGYKRTFPIERDGQIVEAEEFVAKKLGHDLARTNYEVDRSRRGSTMERDAAARGAAAKESARPNAVSSARGF